MYDTVNFRLLQSEAGGVDFLAETPCFLENVGEHYYNGEVVITGSLNGLKISLNKYQMKIKDGSLCNGIWVIISRRWGGVILNGRLKSYQTLCTCQ